MPKAILIAIALMLAAGDNAIADDQALAPRPPASPPVSAPLPPALPPAPEWNCAIICPSGIDRPPLWFFGPVPAPVPGYRVIREGHGGAISGMSMANGGISSPAKTAQRPGLC